MTSMYIGIKTHPDTCLEHWTPKPDLQNWPPVNTKLTTFCIRHLENAENQRPPVTISGQDSYTPRGMELCTPYRSVVADRQRNFSGSSFNNEVMLETPCQKTSSSLNEIDVDLSELKLDEQDDDDQDDCEIWYFCDTTMRGFRDPQVQNCE